MCGIGAAEKCAGSIGVRAGAVVRVARCASEVSGLDVGACVRRCERSASALSVAEQDRVEPLGHLLDAARAAGQAQPASGGIDSLYGTRLSAVVRTVSGEITLSCNRIQQQSIPQ